MGLDAVNMTAEGVTCYGIAPQETYNFGASGARLAAYSDEHILLSG